MQKRIEEEPPGQCEGLQRFHADPIKIIVHRTSGEEVGVLFEWNTGEREPLWNNGPYEDIIYA